MISKDIVDYIKAQNEKGLSKEEIRSALASAGWQTVDIDEAFRYAKSGIPLAPAPFNSQYSNQQGQASQNTQFLASPTDLLKEAWGIYKVRFKTFLGIIFAQWSPSIILIIIGLIYFLLFAILKIENTGPVVGVMSWFMSIFVMIAILFIFIMLIWGQAAMLFAVKDSEENIGVKESYRRGWHKIGSILGIGLLSGIIIMGGYLLLIIPGIIFGVWFSLATYIVIAEGTGGMNAILKSKEYVSGYWWEVFWRFIFIGLVIFGINIVVMLIGLVIPVLPNLLMIFLTPLTVIYSFLVYKNLKAIKEAKGEVKSEFNGGEKTKFIIAGILGVLLFIGLLAIPLYLINSGLGSAKNKAIDAQRISNFQSLQMPLLLYADDNNNLYPSSLSQLVPKYISTLPVDPKTKLPYEYRQLKGGKNYEICIIESNGKKCNQGISLSY